MAEETREEMIYRKAAEFSREVAAAEDRGEDVLRAEWRARWSDFLQPLRADPKLKQIALDGYYDTMINEGKN